MVGPKRPVIPSQSTAACDAAVALAAREAPPSAGVAVELGTWLGHTTRVIAEANPELEIHSFDRFRPNHTEVAKAHAAGVELAYGVSCLPWVRIALGGLRVTLHEGPIEHATWDGESIVLHVDDACKMQAEFDAAIRTFSPSWLPGLTRVVLLDYWWHELYPAGPERERRAYQKRWLAERAGCFEVESDRPMVLRYLGGRLC